MIIQSKGWKIKVKICQRLPILFHAQNQLTHPVEEWKRFRFACDRTDKKNPSGWCYFFFFNFQLTALKKKKHTQSVFLSEPASPTCLWHQRLKCTGSYWWWWTSQSSNSVVHNKHHSNDRKQCERLFLVTDEYKILVFNSVVSSIYRRLSQDHCDL